MLPLKSKYYSNLIDSLIVLIDREKLTRETDPATQAKTMPRQRHKTCWSVHKIKLRIINKWCYWWEAAPNKTFMQAYKPVTHRPQRMPYRKTMEISVRTSWIRLGRSIQTTQQRRCRITLTCHRKIMIHITSEVKEKAHQMLGQTTLKEHRKMWSFERIRPKICSKKRISKCQTFRITVHSMRVANRPLHESIKDLKPKCNRTLWCWKLIQKLKTFSLILLTRRISRIAIIRGWLLSTTTWKYRTVRFLHRGLQRTQMLCSSLSSIISSSVEIEELRIVLEIQQELIRSNSPWTCLITGVTSRRLIGIHRWMRIIQPL